MEAVEAVEAVEAMEAVASINDRGLETNRVTWRSALVFSLSFKLDMYKSLSRRSNINAVAVPSDAQEAAAPRVAPSWCGPIDAERVRGLC